MIRKFLPGIILGLILLSLADRFRAPSHSSRFDLERVSRIPILQGGRIKPLGSVATNSLLMMRGEQSIRQDGRAILSMEWLLEVLFRPEQANRLKTFVIHDPDVLGVMGMTAREKYYSFNDLAPHAETIKHQYNHASQIEGPARNRFQVAIVNLHERLMLYQSLQHSWKDPATLNVEGELTAFEKLVQENRKIILSHQTLSSVDKKTLLKLGTALNNYQFLADSSPLRPLPPWDSANPEDWQTLGAGIMAILDQEQFHPLVMPLARLSDAFEQNDSPGFSAALTTIENYHKTHHGDVIDRVRHEVLFNRVEPFYQGMIYYVLAFLLICLSWLLWPRELYRAGFQALILTFTLHTLGLISRILLQGRPPVTNLYSSAIFVGWAAVLLGIIMELLYKKGFAAVAACAAGFLSLIVAHHLASAGDTMEMMRAVLDSNFWLSTHVVTITIGYSSTFLAGTLAHVYIFKRFLFKSLTRETARSLVQMVYGIVCFSLFFSFIGTVLGGIWADQSWGRFWGWDPKENGALLIVLWNAVILHARWGGYIREHGLMMMAVFGNIITSLSWFGVNMLGIGLHSYGFMDKAAFWLMVFILSQLGVMTLGCRELSDGQGGETSGAANGVKSKS